VDPLPGSFDEFVAAQILPRKPFFPQLFLDYVLSSDSRVIGPRNAKRVIALHALPPDQHILD